MPSRYEPCGLGQMICFRYGTVPVVRSTGGLADTVTEHNPETGKGNGFCFRHYDKKEFLKAIERALIAYHDSYRWRTLVERAMELDFSWDASAKKYIALYRKMKTKITEPAGNVV